MTSCAEPGDELPSTTLSRVFGPTRLPDNLLTQRWSWGKSSIQLPTPSAKHLSKPFDHIFPILPPSYITIPLAHTADKRCSIHGTTALNCSERSSLVRRKIARTSNTQGSILSMVQACTSQLSWRNHSDRYRTSP